MLVQTSSACQSLDAATEDMMAMVDRFRVAKTSATGSGTASGPATGSKAKAAA
jgi:hypothetical protein